MTKISSFAWHFLLDSDAVLQHNQGLRWNKIHLRANSSRLGTRDPLPQLHLHAALHTTGGSRALEGSLGSNE